MDELESIYMVTMHTASGESWDMLSIGPVTQEYAETIAQAMVCTSSDYVGWSVREDDVRIGYGY